MEIAKEIKHKKIINCIIIILLLSAITVTVLVLNQQKTLFLWQTTMGDSLFDHSPNAGQKFIVYQNKANGPLNIKYTFDRKYLPDDLVASVPEDVGYIVKITYFYNSVGKYGNGLKTAYRVDTLINLYDRHSGDYIGQDIVLTGGDPPRSVKASASYGAGDIASESEIKATVNQLIESVRKPVQ